MELVTVWNKLWHSLAHGVLVSFADSLKGHQRASLCTRKSCCQVQRDKWAWMGTLFSRSSQSSKKVNVTTAALSWVQGTSQAEQRGQERLQELANPSQPKKTQSSQRAQSLPLGIADSLVQSCDQKPEAWMTSRERQTLPRKRPRGPTDTREGVPSHWSSKKYSH